MYISNTKTSWQTNIIRSQVSKWISWDSFYRRYSPPLQSNSHTVKLLVFTGTYHYIYCIFGAAVAIVCHRRCRLHLLFIFIVLFRCRPGCLVCLSFDSSTINQTIGCVLSSPYILFLRIFTHLNFQVVAYSMVYGYAISTSQVSCNLFIFCSLLQSPFHITIQFAAHSVNVPHRPFTLFSF